MGLFMGMGNELSNEKLAIVIAITDFITVRILSHVSPYKLANLGKRE